MNLRKSKPTKTKIEASKKIVIFCDTLLAGAVIATFAALFCGFSAGEVAGVVATLSGLSAAAHGFYFWKAKAENLQKYGQGEKITMDGGTDHAAEYGNNY